jgi:hypothetical protein
MMNLTGDGSGLDMIPLPQEMREKVPTWNFFQPPDMSAIRWPAETRPLQGCWPDRGGDNSRVLPARRKNPGRTLRRRRRQSCPLDQALPAEAAVSSERARERGSGPSRGGPRHVRRKKRAARHYSFDCIFAPIYTDDCMSHVAQKRRRAAIRVHSAVHRLIVCGGARDVQAAPTKNSTLSWTPPSNWMGE